MSQVCVFCKGAKVEPGHDDCVWCDNTGVLEIGPKATEVVEPDARALAEECNRLRKERDALQERLNETDAANDRLREALKFYADREHYCFDDDSKWDNVSGEPHNILWRGDDAEYIEDGHIARKALAGKP